jgi:hypothetical protein
MVCLPQLEEYSHSKNTNSKFKCGSTNLFCLQMARKQFRVINIKHSSPYPNNEDNLRILVFDFHRCGQKLWCVYHN